MKKNRIILCVLFIFCLAAIVSIPTSISNQVKEADNPTISSPPGTLIFGTTTGPTSLDPHYAWDTASIDVIEQVVETLFAYDLSDPELNIIPRLAVGLGTWSIDGLRYNVTLKQGVTFHDGSVFNADVVRWNFERLAYFMNLSGNLPLGKLVPMFSTLYLWPDGTPIINSTNVNNDYEVEFVLNKRFVPFEALLCFSGSGIMSLLETPPEDYIDLVDGELVGTGPFVYDNYTGIEVTFHAYPNYWAGAAYIDILKFLIIQDSTLRAIALLAGDIDFIDSFDNSMVQVFRDDPNIVLEEGQSTSAFYLGMNNNMVNHTLRSAISYAINYSYIIEEILGGNAARLKSPIPEGIRYANWSFDVATLNISRARQILVDAGLSSIDIGNDTLWEDLATTNPIATYTYINISSSATSGNIGNLLVDNLAKIGIDVLIETLEWGVFLDRIYNNPDTIHLFYSGWGADYNDPHDYLWLFSNELPSYNLAQVNDPPLQDLIDQGVSELVPSAREAIYDEIQEYLVEDLMPWAYLFVNLQYQAYNNEFLGFQWNPMGKVWFYPVFSGQKIVVSPLGIDFGEVELGNSVSTNITISNIGDQNLEVTNVTFKIGSCADFVIPSIPVQQISPSGSIKIEVTYTPPHLGSCSAILEIISSDPNNPLVEVQLTGRTRVVSNWLVNEVTLDGDSEEWNDAIPYDIPLYQAMGWPTPIYQQSDKVLTIRLKNDGEWLYMFYEIPWSGPESPPESAGIGYHNFTGNPQTNSDSGWVGLGGGTVDYYGWDLSNWQYDELASGQNDVEGMGIIDGDYYRFEFRKRLDSKDGLDWSLIPGETYGNAMSPTEPPFLYVSVWDDDTASVYQQAITLQLMRSDSILIYDNHSLTSDIYFNAGDGIVIGAENITLNGNGYKIIGSGSGSGILSDGYNSVTIKNLTIHGFDTGISIHDGEHNNITVNYISDNNVGIRLTSALNNVTNNIIARNNKGVVVDESYNYIYRNLLINNDKQMENVSGNIWVDPINSLGNFWSNYWGKDNGSDDRIVGDYIGDTDLPHEGVDDRPLLDPSIPEKYGPLPYADWWMKGRGGSPVIILAIDPYGRIISAEVNEIGLNAFYVENEEWDPGEDSIMILIAINPEAPIFGSYAYEITATEDTTYSLELFTSAVGDILLEQSVEDVPIDAGQTDQIGTVIQEAEDPAPGDPPVIVEPGDVIRQDIDAPTVYVSQPGSSEHIWGPIVYVEGTATDESGVDTITVNGLGVVFASTNNQIDPNEVSFSTTVVDLELGENIITINVTGISGNSITLDRTVFRDESPPEIISVTGPLEPLALATSCEITGIFTDLDFDDTHSVTFDWGDDTTSVGTVDHYIVNGSHVYNETGVYIVTLTIEDSSGESDTAMWSQYIVIYDPSGGFVTGGGWIDSPKGAYPAESDLTGKANFGFIAKYKKGTKVPTGNTEFKFHAGDLNFHSDTYQWLVIAGARAMFKGTGTINGEGSYKFMLTAIDGELVSGGSVDQFRLKIWEENEVTGEEIIIYDNMLGAEDDEELDVTTDIGGGSIQIHKKRK